MPTWRNKKQVETALRKARENAKKVREKHGGDSKEFQDAIKNCEDIRFVLDRWDALHS